MRRWILVAICTGVGCGVIPTPASGQDLLVSGRFNHSVIRYDGQSGDFIEVFAQGGGLINAIGMDFGPDGHLYVASGDIPLVNRYNGQTGEFIDSFVVDDPETKKDETGGLAGARGLVFGPDDHLYVSSGISDQVLRYDGSTGQFMGVFAQGGGLDGPIGLAFGNDGELYVASALSDMVIRYDGTTGEFIDQFVCAGAGGLNNPTGVLFGPDGHLYVASALTNQVLLYNGRSGDFIEVFASGEMSVPIGIIFGPVGDFYVASFQTDSVLKYDGTSGEFVEVFATGGGLNGSHFMLFGPNLGDLDGDGSVGASDLLILLASWGSCADCDDCTADLDNNCTVGAADLLILLANWG